MQHHHAGSGRRSVFPADWQTTHAAVVAGTFTATVTIRAAGSNIFDTGTGVTTTVPGTVVYTGPASIAVVSDPQVIRVVDQPDTTSLYEVELPLEVWVVKSGRVVHVDASPDPQLVGRDLSVTGPELGDRRWSRFLHATLIN